MLSNLWARISDEHWIHPKLGYIKFWGNKWEAHPRPSIHLEPRSFNELSIAMEYMEIRLNDGTNLDA